MLPLLAAVYPSALTVKRKVPNMRIGWQGIALRYGTNFAALKRRNKLFSGDVFVGQVPPDPQITLPHL
jgi:hypothetical protein